MVLLTLNCKVLWLEWRITDASVSKSGYGNSSSTGNLLPHNHKNISTLHSHAFKWDHKQGFQCQCFQSGLFYFILFQSGLFYTNIIGREIDGQIATSTSYGIVEDEFIRMIQVLQPYTQSLDISRKLLNMNVKRQSQLAILRILRKSDQKTFL